MARKFHNTEQRQLAKSVLEFIDWQMERTEQQKMVDCLLESVEERMGRERGPRILNTMQVCRLRSDAMDAIKNQLVAQKSGPSDGGVATSFKRLNQQREMQQQYQRYAY